MLHLKGDTIPHAVVIPLGGSIERENQNGGYMEILAHRKQHVFWRVPSSWINYAHIYNTNQPFPLERSTSWWMLLPLPWYQMKPCYIYLKGVTGLKETTLLPVYGTARLYIYVMVIHPQHIRTIVCVGQCSHCFHCLLVQQWWHKHLVSHQLSILGLTFLHGSQSSFIFWA